MEGVMDMQMPFLFAALEASLFLSDAYGRPNLWITLCKVCLVLCLKICFVRTLSLAHYFLIICHYTELFHWLLMVDQSFVKNVVKTDDFFTCSNV